MMIRWTTVILVFALLIGGFALSSCANRPGDNAYGRYSNPASSSSTLEPYNEDYYKDVGM